MKTCHRLKKLVVKVLVTSCIKYMYTTLLLTKHLFDQRHHYIVKYTARNKGGKWLFGIKSANDQNWLRSCIVNARSSTS